MSQVTHDHEIDRDLAADALIDPSRDDTRPQPVEHPRPLPGLRYDVARSLDDVIEAWRLVYAVYRRAGLIDRNAAELHCVPHAIGTDSVVAIGRIESLVVNTLSAYHDGPQGLPLDSVYRRELDWLRRQGRSLIEVGLFADRREHLYRSIEAVMSLMRLSTYFGVHTGATDAVIGVHPHHAAFYCRMLGFTQIGDEKSYETVNHKPVVLLHLNWVEATSAVKPCRGIRQFVENPVETGYFNDRVDLTWEAVADSPIGRRLEACGA